MPNELFYSPYDKDTLITYASDENAGILPPWVTYNNINHCFNGKAPEYPHQTTIQITAVHQESGANDATAFKIIIIENQHPMHRLTSYP